MTQSGGTVPDLSPLLERAGGGDRRALDQMVPLVYGQLKVLAERQLRRERVDHTLNPTALVHEAYLKLAEQTRVEPRSRAHVVALTGRMMRRVLIDHARRTKAAKRGGGVWLRTTLSGKASPAEPDTEELLALDAALEQLQPRQREVVELRFFSGLTEQEIAAVLDISPRTVRREWVKARAWLYAELYPEE